VPTPTNISREKSKDYTEPFLTTKPEKKPRTRSTPESREKKRKRMVQNKKKRAATSREKSKDYNESFLTTKKEEPERPKDVLALGAGLHPSPKGALTEMQKASALGVPPSRPGGPVLKGPDYVKPPKRRKEDIITEEDVALAGKEGGEISKRMEFRPGLLEIRKETIGDSNLSEAYPHLRGVLETRGEKAARDLENQLAATWKERVSNEDKARVLGKIFDDHVVSDPDYQGLSIYEQQEMKLGFITKADELLGQQSRTLTEDAAIGVGKTVVKTGQMMARAADALSEIDPIYNFAMAANLAAGTDEEPAVASVAKFLDPAFETVYEGGRELLEGEELAGYAAPSKEQTESLGRRTLTSAIESSGPMAFTLATTGGLGTLGAGAGSGALYFTQTYGETRDEALALGLSPEKAHEVALQAGIIEGGLGGVSNAAFMKIFSGGVAPTKQAFMSHIKNLGLEVGQEGLEEAAQGYLESVVRGQYGLPSGDPKTQAIEGALAGMLMGAGGTVAGTAGQSRQRQEQTDKFRQILMDTSAPKQDRMNAAEQLASVIAKDDPEMAAATLAYAAKRIDEGKQISPDPPPTLSNTRTREITDNIVADPVAGVERAVAEIANNPDATPEVENIIAESVRELADQDRMVEAVAVAQSPSLEGSEFGVRVNQVIADHYAERMNRGESPSALLKEIGQTIENPESDLSRRARLEVWRKKESNLQAEIERGIMPRDELQAKLEGDVRPEINTLHNQIERDIQARAAEREAEMQEVVGFKKDDEIDDPLDALRQEREKADEDQPKEPEIPEADVLSESQAQKLVSRQARIEDKMRTENKKAIARGEAPPFTDDDIKATLRAEPTPKSSAAIREERAEEGAVISQTELSRQREAEALAGAVPEKYKNKLIEVYGQERADRIMGGIKRVAEIADPLDASNEVDGLADEIVESVQPEEQDPTDAMHRHWLNEYAGVSTKFGIPYGRDLETDSLVRQPDPSTLGRLHKKYGANKKLADKTVLLGQHPDQELANAGVTTELEIDSIIKELVDSTTPFGAARVYLTNRNYGNPMDPTNKLVAELNELGAKIAANADGSTLTVIMPGIDQDQIYEILNELSNQMDAESRSWSEQGIEGHRVAAIFGTSDPEVFVDQVQHEHIQDELNENADIALNLWLLNQHLIDDRHYNPDEVGGLYGPRRRNEQTPGLIPRSELEAADRTPDEDFAKSEREGDVGARTAAVGDEGKDEGQKGAEELEYDPEFPPSKFARGDITGAFAGGAEALQSWANDQFTQSKNLPLISALTDFNAAAKIDVESMQSAISEQLSEQVKGWSKLSKADQFVKITDELNRVKGVTIGKRVMLFADKIANEKEAAQVYFHEVIGHHGIESVLDKKESDAFFDGIRLAKGLKSAQAAREWFAETFAEADARGELEKMDGWRGHWDNFTNMMRRNLRKIFPRIKFSKSEMAGMLRQSPEYQKYAEAKEFVTGKPSDATFAPQPMFAKDKDDDVDPVSPLPPQVAEAYKAAEGIETESFYSRLKDITKNRWHWATRAHKDLDPKKHGNLIVKLREHSAIPEYATTTAFNNIRDIVRGLSKKQYDFFRYSLITSDALRDVEMGVKGQDGELPWGFKSVEEMRKANDKYQEIIGKNPKIKEALEKREEYMDDLRHKMVSEGVLSEAVLEDKRYFHHQVLQHMNEKRAFLGVGQASVKERKRGFERGRGESLEAYNTSYIESEFEVMAQSIARLREIETLKWLDENVNIADQLNQKIENANKNKLAPASLDPDSPHYINVDSEVRPMDRNNVGRVMRINGNDVQVHFYNKKTKAEAVKSFDVGDLQVVDKTADPETVASVIPEGYVEWTPNPQGKWFAAHTLTEGRISELLAGGSLEISKDDLKRVFAKASSRKWIIPAEVASTLDNFRKDLDDQGITKQMMDRWKQWTLLNPYRIWKYNLNNMSGDTDIVIAYDPRIFKYAPKAAVDLARWTRGKKTNPERKALLDQALQHGVIGSGMSAMDIPDITADMKSDRIMRMLNAEGDGIVRSIPKRLIHGYWNTAKGISTWRENVLRLSAYEHFLTELGKGKELFGASNQEIVKAVPEVDRRAALLARELLGDYGNLTEMGNHIRKRLIPFYSWMEINAPRYVRLVKNLPAEGRAESTHFGRNLGFVVGHRAATLPIKMGIFYVAAQGFNAFMGAMLDIDDDEVARANKQLKIIVGKTDDGIVRTMRFQGAFSDFLAWVGLDDWPYDVQRLARGEKGASDMLVDAIKAPVNKIGMGLTPMIKVPVEQFFGLEVYPDVFRPRPMRDRAEALARLFSVEMPYRMLAGKPRRGSDWVDKYLNDALSVVSYESDPGEAAYWDTMSAVHEFKDGFGARYTPRMPNDKGAALYQYKKARRIGDAQAMQRYLEKYIELGGDEKSMEKSVDLMDPLASIPKDKRQEFIDGLSPQQKTLLKKADEWYENVWRSDTHGQYRRARMDNAVAKEAFYELMKDHPDGWRFEHVDGIHIARAKDGRKLAYQHEDQMISAILADSRYSNIAAKIDAPSINSGTALSIIRKRVNEENAKLKELQNDLDEVLWDTSLSEHHEEAIKKHKKHSDKIRKRIEAHHKALNEYVGEIGEEPFVKHDEVILRQDGELFKGGQVGLQKEFRARGVNFKTEYELYPPEEWGKAIEDQRERKRLVQADAEEVLNDPGSTEEDKMMARKIRDYTVKDADATIKKMKKTNVYIKGYKLVRSDAPIPEIGLDGKITGVTKWQGRKSGKQKGEPYSSPHWVIKTYVDKHPNKYALQEVWYFDGKEKEYRSGWVAIPKGESPDN
jgi:hypothetical protein